MNSPCDNSPSDDSPGDDSPSDEAPSDEAPSDDSAGESSATAGASAERPSEGGPDDNGRSDAGADTPRDEGGRADVAPADKGDEGTDSPPATENDLPAPTRRPARLGVNLKKPEPVVRRIYPDGPAEGSGLRVGDIVRGIDDAETATTEALLERLKTYAAGDRIELRVDRDGRAVTVPVTLGEANR